MAFHVPQYQALGRHNDMPPDIACCPRAVIVHHYIDAAWHAVPPHTMMLCQRSRYAMSSTSTAAYHCTAHIGTARHAASMPCCPKTVGVAYCLHEGGMAFHVSQYQASRRHNAMDHYIEAAWHAVPPHATTCCASAVPPHCHMPCHPSTIS